MCPPDGHDPDAPDPSPPSPEAATRAATAQLVRELVLHDGDTLPPLAVARVSALAQAAVEPLIAVLIDNKLLDPHGPASGWGPVHAAKLLGQLSPKQALAPLLDVLAIATRLKPLFDAVYNALSPLGVALVTPVLARLPTAIGAYRRELWGLLAGAGVREPRVLAALLDALSESPADGALCLAEYGDKDALPELSSALDAYPDPRDDVGGDHTVFELREAILELGGMLTPSQVAKYEFVLATRRRELAALTLARREPTDRTNDRCPCGSGRLYKSCCLQ